MSPHTLRRIGRWLRRWPVTVTIGVAVLAIAAALAPQTAAAHGDLVTRLGVTPEALRSLRLWTFLASPLVQSDPGLRPMFWLLALGVIASLALLEWRVGGVRTVLVFFGSELAVEPARLLGLALLGRLGNAEAATLLHVGDTGASAAAVAVAGAFVMTLPAPLRRLGLLALAAWLVWSVYLFRMDVGIDHAAGLAFGLAVGWWWRPSRSATAAGERPARPSEPGMRPLSRSSAREEQ